MTMEHDKQRWILMAIRNYLINYKCKRTKY